MVWCPLFQSRVRADGGREYRVGHELVDEFLEFASGRARPSTVRAYAHDLSVFFGVIPKEPKDVTPKDVLRFVTAQREPRTWCGYPTGALDCRPRPSSDALPRCRASIATWSSEVTQA